MEKYDVFGAPIGITFKGKSNHATSFGGFISIFMIIMVFIALIFETMQLFTGAYSSSA